MPKAGKQISEISKVSQETNSTIDAEKKLNDAMQNYLQIHIEGSNK